MSIGKELCFSAKGQIGFAYKKREFSPFFKVYLWQECRRDLLLWTECLCTPKNSYIETHCPPGCQEVGPLGDNQD